MNGLKITNPTQETLLGPAFKLLKGTRTNFGELDYDYEECYKALSEKIDWDNPKGGDLTKPLSLVMNGNHKMVPVDYFFNIRFSSITRRNLDHDILRLHKELNATQYDLPGIEDMVRNIWSPVKVDALRCDGTLTRLRTSLDDITKNIRMEILPQRRWSLLEKKRANIMIKAIDKQLKERRMMRSFEKLLSGRHYGYFNEQYDFSDTQVITMKMEILLEPTSNKFMVDPYGFKGYLKMEVKVPDSSCLKGS
ncbi:hypothetical protein Tco_1016883 [Tanacetum coccineum]|uniref:Uncharacterized protein n=1 Tax=Tanacetum coccineum TaxID=301880 RepID=A0ABQ5FRA0_9ASTR